MRPLVTSRCVLIIALQVHVYDGDHRWERSCLTIEQEFRSVSSSEIEQKWSQIEW